MTDQRTSTGTAEVTDEMVTAAMRAFEPLSSVLRYREKDKWHTCDIMAMSDAIRAALAAQSNRPAQLQPDPDHPDCSTDRECELYDALMGLASHATAWHPDYKQWTQGGVTLEPIVSKALRLGSSSLPSTPSGTEPSAPAPESSR